MLERLKRCLPFSKMLLLVKVSALHAFSLKMYYIFNYSVNSNLLLIKFIVHPIFSNFQID